MNIVTFHDYLLDFKKTILDIQEFYAQRINFVVSEIESIEEGYSHRRNELELVQRQLNKEVLDVISFVKRNHWGNLREMVVNVDINYHNDVLKEDFSVENFTKEDFERLCREDRYDYFVDLVQQFRVYQASGKKTKFVPKKRRSFAEAFYEKFGDDLLSSNDFGFLEKVKESVIEIAVGNSKAFADYKCVRETEALHKSLFRFFESLDFQQFIYLDHYSFLQNHAVFEALELGTLSYQDSFNTKKPWPALYEITNENKSFYLESSLSDANHETRLVSGVDFDRKKYVLVLKNLKRAFEGKGILVEYFDFEKTELYRDRLNIVLEAFPQIKFDFTDHPYSQALRLPDLYKRKMADLRPLPPRFVFLQPLRNDFNANLNYKVPTFF